MVTHISYDPLSLVVTCPRIEPQAHTRLFGAACQGSNSKCSAQCHVTCKSGFELSGNKYVTCKGDGTWDRQIGYCKGKSLGD